MAETAASECRSLEHAAAWSEALAEQILLRASSSYLLREMDPEDSPAATAAAAAAAARWGSAEELAKTLRDNVAAIRGAVRGALDEASKEAQVLTAQLVSRGELQAQREAEFNAVETAHRRQLERRAAERLAGAQALVARRAVDAANRALLDRCWRALCLHASANRLLADRKRFRILAQSAQPNVTSGLQSGPGGAAARDVALGGKLRPVD